MLYFAEMYGNADLRSTFGSPRHSKREGNGLSCLINSNLVCVMNKHGWKHKILSS